MASTIVEMQLPQSTSSPTLELYPLGSTTLANSPADTLTQETNADGFWRATVTEALSGIYRAVAVSGGNGVASGYVSLADDTSTYRVESSYAIVALTTAAIADAVWDEVITGAEHNVNNSAAKFLREGSEAGGLTGQAQSATSTTIVLESGSVGTDDIYNDERITIIEGTGAGQARLILDSVASTDTATVDRAWTVTPDSTSIYVISGADVSIRSVHGDNTASSNLRDDYNGTGYTKTNSEIGDVTSLGANGAGLTAIPWNATWDTEVQSEVQDAIEANHLDHLLAVTYDAGAKPGVAGSLLNEIIQEDAASGKAQFTAEAVELAPSSDTVEQTINVTETTVNT